MSLFITIKKENKMDNYEKLEEELKETKAYAK